MSTDEWPGAVHWVAIHSPVGSHATLQYRPATGVIRCRFDPSAFTIASAVLSPGPV